MESEYPNEPMLLRAMRVESAFIGSIVRIRHGAERSLDEAQCLMARAEAEYRRTDRIVGLMMPEVMRMLLREGLARKAANAQKAGM